MTMLTRKAVEDLGLGIKIADRCRNFFAMGLVYWLYGRDLSATLRFIRDKFGNRPDIAQANEKALRAGWNYGETTEAFASSFRVEPAKLPPGTYLNIMGNQALAWGLLAAAEMSGKELFLGTYPITPASDILHELTKFKNFGVRTFQAEDEIAAVCAAIGASFGGAMAVTTTSGPGVALKSEGIGLAVMLELPLIDRERAARWSEHRAADQDGAGRPVPGHPRPQWRMSLAGAGGRQSGRLLRRGPGSVAHRRPLHDPGHAVVGRVHRQRLGAVADPQARANCRAWRSSTRAARGGECFLPYDRDERLARPWALPGTPGPDAPHRRAGEAESDRQRQLRLGQPRSDGPPAAPEGRERGR